MTATSPLVRIGAPVLLFTYGVLRLIDGYDGHHDKGGPLWNIGHVLFFISFVLLGVLVVGVRAMLPARRRGYASVAVGAGVFGVGCFLWVVAGDLFPSLPQLPSALQIGGPALFQLGMLALLIMLVVARLLPIWAPVLVLLAFSAIAIDLDLIPLAAVALLIGLLPVGRAPRRAADPALR